jgi:hypothetical protein
MSTSGSGSTDNTESTPMVWLWERAPDSVELQKVRVPAAIIPSGWLEPLQRRYHAGDRVIFTWHDEAKTGTIVQDQGMYVAIDGDAPDDGYTFHKTDVLPLGLQHEPELPDPVEAVPAGTPHDPPSIRTSDRTITARWNLGKPTEGWQPQAGLQVTYHDQSGFVAILHSVDEFDHDGFHHERRRGATPIAVHYQLARRFSQRALRETYHAAVREVRTAFDDCDPTIATHFVLLPACSQTDQ